MATKTSVGTTNVLSNSTDALFRAWVQYIEDTIVTTGGWSVTSDTGQMTIASAAHPTLTNSKVGYRIYKDPTNSVYIKMYFGSANDSANTPGVWFVIGTGSDGAGTITGICFDDSAATQPTTASAGNTTSSCTFYSSADSGRFCFMLGPVNNATQWVWGFEKLRDSSGSYTTGACMLTFQKGGGNGNNQMDRSQYLILGTGVAGQPPMETSGISAIFPISNPSTFGGNTFTSCIICWNGVAVQPGMNFQICRSSDFGQNTSFSISIYGANHTYMRAQGTQATTIQGANVSGCTQMMLYE